LTPCKVPFLLEVEKSFPMSKSIRSFLIFAAPLAVGVLNVFHPANPQHTPIYNTVHGVVGWWILLHILNLFGFALLGLAAYLLILERHGIAAVVAKVALVIFVPTYVGFDALIGIGTGNLVQYANQLPLGQLAAFMPAIEAFWNNETAMVLAIVGSIAWSVAMSASAISFVHERRPMAVAFAILAGAYTGWGASSGMFGTLSWWIGVAVIAAISVIVVRPPLPYTPLIVAGILFGTTHVVPFGPLGMACFLAAAAVIQLAPDRFTLKEMAAART
jgi:hypothetical protein